MFVSKKKFNQLAERVTLLEKNSTVNSFEYGKLTLQDLVRKLPKIIKKHSNPLHIMVDAKKIATVNIPAAQEEEKQ